MSNQPPPAPTASAVGLCPTVIQIVVRPGTEVYTAPLHLPTTPDKNNRTCLQSKIINTFLKCRL